MVRVFVAGAEVPRRRSPVPAGTDVGLHHEPIPLVGTQLLVRQVNFDPFRTAKERATLLLGFTGGAGFRLVDRLLSREQTEQGIVLTPDLRYREKDGPRHDNEEAFMWSHE